MGTPRQGATNFNTVQSNGTAETINSIAITTQFADPDGNILIASGTTLPTDGSAGYAKGSIFLLTNVATGVSGKYNNIGTTTSSQFVIEGPSVAGVIAGTAQVTLSSAQILALNATPVTLIAAPGAGKIIVVEEVIFKMITTATAYANGGALEFRYTNAAGAKVTGADLAAAVITAGAGTSYTVLGSNSSANVTAVANAPIVVDNATAAFITGTGTAQVTIRYLTVTP